MKYSKFNLKKWAWKVSRDVALVTSWWGNKSPDRDKLKIFCLNESSKVDHAWYAMWEADFEEINSSFKRLEWEKILNELNKVYNKIPWNPEDKTR